VAATAAEKQREDARKQDGANARFHRPCTD
jgi:hypothetical protein